MNHPADHSADHPLDDFLKPGGTLSQKLKNYEFRPEQLEMSSKVYDAFEENEHLIIEAGTGVGKSFGYLIPAILQLNKLNKPVVISTNTIQLQEQIFHKDLPFLKKHLSIEFSYVLGKGRNNYISLRRFQLALNKKRNLFENDEETQELTRIDEWLNTTVDGSRSSLSFRPSNKVWESVRSDRDNCMGAKCPLHQKCHYQRAKWGLKKADIVVVNHSLLFSDMQLRLVDKGLLPPYKSLVIDEAHTIESTASNHFGMKVSNFQFNYFFSELYQPQKNKGYFANHHAADRLSDIMTQLPPEIDSFFDNVAQYHLEHTKKEEKVYRIREANFVGTEALVNIKVLNDILADLLTSANNDEDELQIQSFMEKLLEMARTLSFIIFQEDSENFVYWSEIGGKFRQNISLSASPIDISIPLQQLLFNKTPSVILTSATLATGSSKNSFEFFASRIGAQKFKSIQTGSPFNYKDNVQIRIPENIVNPKDPDFEDQILKCVEHYVHMTNGGAFVLFTSFYLLNKAYKALARSFETSGYKVYCQGQQLERNQMLEKFKEDKHSVLFGTDSFWEGVDVQGEALRNVIITKLPFSVPTHPVTEAKFEAIKESGKHPFKELSLPQAIIKFKQGFGRLIRSKEDKGMICVLDSRIIHMHYGRSFLNALPECNLIVEDLPFLD